MILLRVVAGIWIAAGIGLTVLGLFTLASGLLVGMLTVSGAGTFRQVMLILVPALLILGPFVVVCGIKLMRGRSWARLCLEIATWISILLTLTYTVTSAIHDWEIAKNDTITRSFLLLVLCVLPLIVILCVMRTSNLKRALNKAA